MPISSYKSNWYKKSNKKNNSFYRSECVSLSIYIENLYEIKTQPDDTMCDKQLHAMLFKYKKRRNNVKGSSDSSLTLSVGFVTVINDLHPIECVLCCLTSAIANLNTTATLYFEAPFFSLLLLLLIAQLNGYNFMENATHNNIQKRETEHVSTLCHIRGG